MNDCDLCGQSDAECHCYIRELEERIEILEDELDKLTFVVEKISDWIERREKNER